MGKKSICFLIFALVWMAVNPAPQVSARDLGSSQESAPEPPRDYFQIYSPMVANGPDYAGWQCYPMGGTNCSNWPILNSVAMISASEGWAVGKGGVILHYTNNVWQSVSSPTLLNLYSVALVSPTEGWAVGESGIILQYSQGDWKKVPSPTNIILLSVSMITANEGWAVGGVILHFTNGVWKIDIDPSPGYDYLHSVAMVSSSEGWAVGTAGRVAHSAILHYTNGAWQAPAVAEGLGLSSVGMVSASEGWAVGYYALLHYIYGEWISQLNGPYVINCLAMISPNEGWAMGWRFDSGDGVTLHFKNGAWQEFSSPTSNRLSSIAMVSANEGWAVGGGIILHYIR